MPKTRFLKMFIFEGVWPLTLSVGCVHTEFELPTGWVPKSLVIAQILRQRMRLHKGIYASSWQHQFSFLVMSHDSVGGCVCPLVGQFMGWSIGPSFHNGFVSAGRDKPANNYIRQQDSIASTPTSSTLIAGCIH